MKSRCTNPQRDHYELYGGRGISVCDRWLHSYLNFLSDMGRAPSEAHSLDRIDVNGPYDPSNCRWATQEVQLSNMRVNRLITKPDGTTCTMAQLSRETGVKYTTLIQRYEKGWTYERMTLRP